MIQRRAVISHMVSARTVMLWYSVWMQCTSRSCLAKPRPGKVAAFTCSTYFITCHLSLVNTDDPLHSVSIFSSSTCVGGHMPPVGHWALQTCYRPLAKVQSQSKISNQCLPNSIFNLILNALLWSLMVARLFPQPGVSCSWLVNDCPSISKDWSGLLAPTLLRRHCSPLGSR